MGTDAQIRSLLDSGQTEAAVVFAGRQAAAGDAEALFRVADWRLYGLYGPRDMPLALDLLGRAAAKGHGEAARARAYLIAAGLGCEADTERAREALARVAGRDRYAALQLQILPMMMADADADARPRETVHEGPDITIVRGLLLPDECRYLQMIGQPRLQPSLVVDPATGSGVPDKVRTSDTYSILAMEEDLVLHAINRRIARATGTSHRHGEPLTILRYAPGQEYKPHHDAYAGATHDTQRALTALVWLNDDYAGGETEFPRLKLKLRGKTGDALIFANLTHAGDPHPDALHAGRPVTTGVKWMASRWIRTGIYEPE